MTHINLDVNIDFAFDDKWGKSVDWLKTKVMRKLETAVLDLFEYPLYADADLEIYNIWEGEKQNDT